MNTLVTGSTGFIGSHLCRLLLAEGHQVRAFHRSTSPLTALQGLEVEHAIGDITQPESLEQAMQGIEVVFHAAAQLGEPHPPQRMFAVTVEGTRNVLQAAAHAGVRRLVHTSSVAALGVPSYPYSPSGKHSPETRPIDENHTWNYPPRWWPYGYAKYLAELEVQQAVAQGLDVAIVNPAVVIGPGDLNRVSGDVIIHAARGHLVVSPTGGLNIVHVADVARGHLAALKHGQTGQRYILGGENLTHLQFLRLMAEITAVHPPFFTVPASLLRLLAGPISAFGHLLSLPVNGSILHKAGYYFYYDTHKAQQDLSLPAPLPPRQAIAEAFTWFKDQRMI